LAANVDLLLIVSGLDHDLNLRRLERYLAMALSGATEPVIVLNKSDVCPRLDAAIGAVRSVAAGHPVLVCSALDKTGVEALRMLIAPGRTAAMVGSSGAGKSTLLNALLGSSVAATRAVREHDSRGRHTTTHREMFRLPGAGILLDQPGLREIKLWPAGGGVCQAFPDVAEAALACRFRDCSHSGEPGCAVTAAVGQERLESYRKLATQTGAIARKRQDRERSRALRKFLRTHDKRG
jgi:ribosome biogenesis GTPase